MGFRQIPVVVQQVVALRPDFRNVARLHLHDTPVWPFIKADDGESGKADRGALCEMEWHS